MDWRGKFHSFVFFNRPSVMYDIKLEPNDACSQKKEESFRSPDFTYPKSKTYFFEKHNIQPLTDKFAE